MHHDEQPHMMSIEEIRTAGLAVAEEMKSAETLTPELRARFIAVRGALFQRGCYDPVLVRFDTASAPRATVAEVAERMREVATSV